MSFGESLTTIRKSKGISRKDFAEQLEIPYTTLRNYETDQREPGHKLLIKMAMLLQVSVDELIGHRSKNKNAPLYSSEALKLAADYDTRMDNWGRKQVRSTADIEIARCAESVQSSSARKSDETVYYITSWFYRPMSAGTGEQAGDEQPENLRLIKEPPRGTSYVAPINGDSMEPTYRSGDKLFIHACEEIEPGQIGVFFMDGQQWVKELGDGVLISHNPNYPPRPMTEDIRCQGLVLGVCDESYFA